MYKLCTKVGSFHGPVSCRGATELSQPSSRILILPSSATGHVTPAMTSSTDRHVIDSVLSFVISGQSPGVAGSATICLSAAVTISPLVTCPS